MVVGSGVVLGGKYQLISEIGRGGMGTVWRAKRIDLDALVAIKLMKGDVPAKHDALERFRREARAAAALRGPHVVQIVDYGVDDASGAPFIAMELLEGVSLRERLDAEKRLPAAEVANVIAQAARGLSRAHAANVIHRDLKPENVFLVENEDAELVKLLDFGIAKAELSSGEFGTATGTVIGTPHYMSPEQVQPSLPVDHRSDIWSLGVIAAECLIGARPFDADTLPELAMKICLGRSRVPSSVCPVPAGFDAFFAKACAADPERRFQSATELARALTEVCAGALTPPPGDAAVDLAATLRLASSGEMGNLARSADAPPVHSRPTRRRRLLGWAGAGLVLALGGAALTWIPFSGTSKDAAPSGTEAPVSAATAPASEAPVMPTGAAPISFDAARAPAAKPGPSEPLQQPESALGAAKSEPARAAPERPRAREPRRRPPTKPIDAFDLQ